MGGLLSSGVLFTTTALAGGLLAAGSAHAQAAPLDAPAAEATAQQPADAGAPSALEEAESPASSNSADIVVTANRREERLLDVAQAVSATSGAQLDRQNIVQLQSLRTIDPSVSYRVSTSPGSSAFAVRGIGTSSFSAGIEQSVSTVLDGVVLGDPAALQTLADVERIEILRGPQGMLFGKNASSGVVHIITARPNFDDTSLRVRAQYGENNEFIVQAVANVPVADNLALRFTYVHNQLDGWVYSVPLREDLNPIGIDGGTVKLLWEPDDVSSIYLTADYNYTGEFCCQQVIRSTPNPNSAIAVADARYGIIPSATNFRTAVDGRGDGNGEAYGFSGTFEREFGDYTWTTIAAYRTSSRRNFYDADFVDYDYVNTNGGTRQDTNSSVETRITSPVGPVFDFVAGLFFYQQENDGIIGQTGRFTIPASGNVLPPSARLETTATRALVNSNSFAVFGQGNLHITPQLDLTLGGRFTRDRARLVNTAGPYLDPSLPLRGGYPARGIPTRGYIGFPGPFTTPCVRTATLPAYPNCFDALRQETGAENFSYRAILKYEPTDDLMAYVSYSKGYKGPGFSALSLLPQQILSGNTNQAIEPEIPTAWEIGAKGSFFDRRVTVTLAAFDTTYDGFQAQVSTPTPDGFISRIQNAGTVKTRGIEVQVATRPFEYATFDVGATYLDAKYGDFPGVACYTTNITASPTIYQPGCDAAAGNTINVRGNRVDNAPEFQYFIRASYERPALIGSLTGIFDANWAHRSSVFFSATNDPRTFQEGYGLLGGQIGVGAADDSWRLVLYGTNILNKIWAANISASPTPALNPGGSIQYFSPDSFRHIGAKAEFRF